MPSKTSSPSGPRARRTADTWPRRDAPPRWLTRVPAVDIRRGDGGEACEQLGAHQWRVARHDDHVALVVGVVGKGGERHTGGVAGPALHVLLDEHDGHVGGDLLLQGLGDPFGTVADDHHDPLERQRAERVDHVQHHRASAQRVEDLGGVGAQPLPLARSKDHRDERSGGALGCRAHVCPSSLSSALGGRPRPSSHTVAIVARRDPTAR